MFWVPILSLLLIPTVSLLLLLCIRKNGTADEEHGTHVTMDGDDGDDVTYRTNKTREKASQQRLSVRGSKLVSKLISVDIQSIPGLPLDQFVGRVARMHQDRDKLFREEYEALADLVEDCTIVAALKPENALKNRYKNILPYEHSRIILKKESEEHTEVWSSRSTAEKSDGSGFINASYISGYSREREYIAAQGPLPETVTDFWWMIWQENTSQLIMACSLIESGRVKCSSYWPNEKDGHQDYGHVRVTLLSKRLSPYYITRVFSISLVPTLTPAVSVSSLTPDSPSERGEETVTAETDRHRTVTQYQFTGWPDFGTPLTASPLLGLVRRVRSAVTPSDGPILVHCSAGVGRTGTFIMLDIMLQRMAVESRVEVRHTVQLLRKERGYMVQSLAQYVFLHDALVEAFLCGVTEIPSQQLEAKCKEFAADNQLLDQLLAKRPDPSTFFVHPTAVDKLNAGKNRDCTVIPYQRTCVPLLQYKPESESFDVSIKDSYINASFAQGYWLDNNFIVTQEPLPDTTEDFWCLLAQQNCPCIISLQTIRGQEDGSAFSLESVDSLIDVAHYLPNDSESELEFNQFKVEQLECTPREDQLFVERKLLIKWGNKKHRVTHFTFHFNRLLLSNYSQTNIEKIPFGLRELVSFVNHTRGIYRSQQIEINPAQPQRSKHPIMIYDKLGTNLCGVFTALFIGMDNLDNEQSFDLLQCCRNLCSERPKMITSIGDVFLILRGLVLYQIEFRK